LPLISKGTCREYGKKKSGSQSRSGRGEGGKWLKASAAHRGAGPDGAKGLPKGTLQRTRDKKAKKREKALYIKKKRRTVQRMSNFDLRDLLF